MDDRDEDEKIYRIPVRVSGAAAAAEKADSPAAGVESGDDAIVSDKTGASAADAFEITVESEEGAAAAEVEQAERRRHLEFAREKNRLEEQVRKLQADLYQAMARAQTSEAAASEKSAQLARQQADFQNARRRLDKERDDAARYAQGSLLTDLLPVMDNFELALAVSPGPETAADIHKGVLLIYRQLLEVLSRYDLKPLEAVGQPFDPNFHEAVMRTVNASVPADHVAKEHRKGYYHKDRLLRPAMVEVSAGGGDEAVVRGETETGASNPDESPK